LIREVIGPLKPTREGESEKGSLRSVLENKERGCPGLIT